MSIATSDRGTEAVHGRSDCDFVLEYARRTPLALALERALECELYRQRTLARPILDLGCGDGLFAELAFGSDSQIDYGLDPDPLEIERSRLRQVYRQTLAATGDAIPLPDASLSTVISNSVLEHIPDLQAVLADVRRVLRPGGELLITVPTDKFEHYSVVARILASLGFRGLEARWCRWYDDFWRHYHFLPPEGWKLMLENAGFEVREVIDYASPWRATLHDLLVPFAMPSFVAQKVFGRYFAIPILRRISARLMRPFLPGNSNAACLPGTGGLVFLRAARK